MSYSAANARRMPAARADRGEVEARRPQVLGERVGDAARGEDSPADVGHDPSLVVARGSAVRVVGSCDDRRRRRRARAVPHAAADPDRLARRRDLIEWAPFDDFLADVVRLYPRLHETLEREVVDGHSLLYRWPGSAPAAASDPLVLMAHLDVVPVVAEEWAHAPFAAEIVGDGEDAEIHARGAIDDKGALVAILEAVEQLAEGFAPAHDVYLSFGHNEETGRRCAGDRRAAARSRHPSRARDRRRRRRRRRRRSRVSVPTAMVGVAERGVMTVLLTARENGGHASTPPAMPATVRLARAIDRCTGIRSPRASRPRPRTVRDDRPHAPQPLRWVFQNLALTGPLLARVFPHLGPR
jgi:carboxypeptidase PM20D1